MTTGPSVENSLRSTTGYRGSTIPLIRPCL